jgi:hypothetical protein
MAFAYMNMYEFARVDMSIPGGERQSRLAYLRGNADRLLEELELGRQLVDEQTDDGGEG